MNIVNKINCFAQNDPMAVVLSSFLAGLLFSGVSFGIVYVILFLIFWEFLYFGYLSCNERRWDFDYRILVILAAFLGFLVGAFFHDADDHYESFNKFKDDMEYYGKEFEWYS